MTPTLADRHDENASVGTAISRVGEAIGAIGEPFIAALRLHARSAMVYVPELFAAP
jgi:hypothetical protein